MCLHRGGFVVSQAFEELIWYGGSSNMEDGERSAVFRSLMTYAWPPMASAEPGRTREVVTPPDMDNA